MASRSYFKKSQLSNSNVQVIPGRHHDAFQPFICSHLIAFKIQFKCLSSLMSEWADKLTEYLGEALSFVAV